MHRTYVVHIVAASMCITIKVRSSSLAKCCAIMTLFASNFVFKFIDVKNTRHHIGYFIFDGGGERTCVIEAFDDVPLRIVFFAFFINYGNTMATYIIASFHNDTLHIWCGVFAAV